MFAHVLVGSNQLTKCKQTLKICFDDLISVIILPTSAFFFFFLGCNGNRTTLTTFDLSHLLSQQSAGFYFQRACWRVDEV